MSVLRQNHHLFHGRGRGRGLERWCREEEEEEDGGGWISKAKRVD